MDIACASSGRVLLAIWSKAPTVERYGTFFIAATSSAVVAHIDFDKLLIYLGGADKVEHVAMLAI